MGGTSPAPRRNASPWKYALLGGLASVPVAAGEYWLSGAGDTFPITFALVGGVVAGALARRRFAHAGRAGAGAGAVGGLVALGWILTALLDTAADFAAAWSTPVAGVLIAVVFGLVVLEMAALVGLIGGAIGGWLTTKLGGRLALAAGN